MQWYERRTTTKVETHQSFTLLDILLLEQELSIEIREVNSVEVQERDMAETSEDYVLHWTRHQKMVLAPQPPYGKYSERSHSSHPIPPAPTSNTFVSRNRECSSGPRIASACKVRARAVDMVGRTAGLKRSVVKPFCVYVLIFKASKKTNLSSKRTLAMIERISPGLLSDRRDDLTSRQTSSHTLSRS